jgi:hypothetical protein
VREPPAVVGPGEFIDARRLAAVMGVSTTTIEQWSAAGMPSETWGIKRTRRFQVSEVIVSAGPRGGCRPGRPGQGVAVPNQLPSGRWRARVRDPRSGRQLSAHSVIGGPASYPDRGVAAAAECEAAEVLRAGGKGSAVTVAAFYAEWTTDPEWVRRRGESTNLHNWERTGKFVERYGIGRCARSTMPWSSNGFVAASASGQCRRCGCSSTMR